MSSESFHLPRWEKDQQDKDKPHIEPFSLKFATENQQNALRDLAQQAGFKDLRGFNKWMEAADITYYDLIKVASPE